MTLSRSAPTRLVHKLLPAGMICLVAALPAVSLALGGGLGAVAPIEVKELADGKCDGLEIEALGLLAGDASADLSPPLASFYCVDESSIDIKTAFGRAHLQRGPPRS